ncbi:25465_t:CDS:1, partial [Gigaspora margarita]
TSKVVVYILLNSSIAPNESVYAANRIHLNGFDLKPPYTDADNS